MGSLHFSSMMILGLSIATQSNAQSANNNAPIELGTITIEGSAQISDVEISEDDLRRSSPTDLQDVFKNEPTITVGSSLPISQKLYVNGVEENNLAITIDGNRQNNKIFHHNATTLIDPALLKAVRINPGVATADAGPGALAGSVAYETKDVDDLLPEDRRFGGTLGVNFDSNGSTTTPALSAYGRSGGFEFLGFVKNASGDEREDGNGDDIPGSKSALSSGLAKIAYESEQGNRFEITVEQVVDDEARPYRADIGQTMGGRPVPLTRNYDLARRNLTLTYEDASESGFWSPYVLLGFSNTGLDIVEPEQLIFGDTESVNGVVKNTFAVNTGTVSAGLDFFADNGTLDFRSLEDTTLNENAREDLLNIGLFTQARLGFSDNLDMSLGVRADYQEFESVDGSTFDDQGASANASIEFNVTESVTLSAGASHVWAGVPLAENFIMNPLWTYPEDGIEPVTSDNLYAAASYKFGKWLIDGKLFSTQIDNARTPNYSAGPALNADVESSGLEVGVEHQWRDGFARFGYADIDTEIDGNTADSFAGRYLTTPIGQVVSLEIAHRLPRLGLVFGTDAEIVLSESDTFNAEPDAPARGQPLPSYEVINAYVEYLPEAIDNLSVRGEISNLLDENYASRATYGQEFESVDPLREPGRSLKLTASYQF